MSAPARRDRLDDLDALTDQFDPLLDHMADVVRGVERYLANRPPISRRRRRASPHKQVVTCPTCEDILPGLLSGCRKPTCVRAAIAADVALDLRCGE